MVFLPWRTEGASNQIYTVTTSLSVSPNRYLSSAPWREIERHRLSAHDGRMLSGDKISEIVAP